MSPACKDAKLVSPMGLLSSLSLKFELSSYHVLWHIQLLMFIFKWLQIEVHLAYEDFQVPWTKRAQYHFFTLCITANISKYK